MTFPHTEIYNKYLQGFSISVLGEEICAGSLYHHPMMGLRKGTSAGAEDIQFVLVGSLIYKCLCNVEKLKCSSVEIKFEKCWQTVYLFYRCLCFVEYRVSNYIY
jgi:hypothetical protein